MSQNSNNNDIPSKYIMKRMFNKRILSILVGSLVAGKKVEWIVIDINFREKLCDIQNTWYIFMCNYELRKSKKVNLKRTAWKTLRIRIIFAYTYEKSTNSILAAKVKALKNIVVKGNFIQKIIIPTVGGWLFRKVVL